MPALVFLYFPNGFYLNGIFIKVKRIEIPTFVSTMTHKYTLTQHHPLPVFKMATMTTFRLAY